MCRQSSSVSISLAKNVTKQKNFLKHGFIWSVKPCFSKVTENSYLWKAKLKGDSPWFNDPLVGVPMIKVDRTENRLTMKKWGAWERRRRGKSRRDDGFSLAAGRSLWVVEMRTGKKPRMKLDLLSLLHQAASWGDITRTRRSADLPSSSPSTGGQGGEESAPFLRSNGSALRNSWWKTCMAPQLSPSSRELSSLH